MSLDILWYLNSLAAISIAELGDKTQMLTIALACRGDKYRVFLGSFLGFVVVNSLCIALGAVVKQLILGINFRVITAVLFIVVGIFSLRTESIHENFIKDTKVAFLTTFTLVSLSEIADKTNLVTLGISFSSPSVFSCFAGMITSAFLMFGLAVLIGSEIARYLDIRKLKLFFSFIFIIAGILMLIGGFFEIMRS